MTWQTDIKAKSYKQSKNESRKPKTENSTLKIEKIKNRKLNPKHKTIKTRTLRFLRQLQINFLKIKNSHHCVAVHFD